MNKVLKIIAALCIVGAIVFIGYKLFVNENKKELTETIQSDKSSPIKETPTVDQNEKTGKDEALPVKALQIKRGNLALRLNISATADVREKAVIRAELSGTIEDIRVNVGDWVQQDQLMVKLNDVERRLEVQQREVEKLKSYSQYLVSESTAVENPKLTNEQRANLETLKKRYLQAKKDFESGKIILKDFEKIDDEYQKALIFSGDLRDELRKAQEGLSSAIIGLKTAEINLKRTEVRAPFQGVIGDIIVSKGEKVTPSQELLRIVNLKTLYLRGFALESEIANLKTRTKVRIKFDSYPEQFYYGEIQAINPEIDATRKTITVYVNVDNKDKLFFPGMHAEIDVEYKVFENVIKVPRNAVIYRQDRYLVFVVRDMKGNTGTANWEYVTIGHQNDDEIEILTGVQEGDMVLTEGQKTLAHQSKVRIIQE